MKTIDLTPSSLLLQSAGLQTLDCTFEILNSRTVLSQALDYVLFKAKLSGVLTDTQIKKVLYAGLL